MTVRPFSMPSPDNGQRPPLRVLFALIEEVIVHGRPATAFALSIHFDDGSHLIDGIYDSLEKAARNAVGWETQTRLVMRRSPDGGAA